MPELAEIAGEGNNDTYGFMGMWYHKSAMFAMVSGHALCSTHETVSGLSVSAALS